MTAILLLSRDRLARGKTVRLVELALADYREDPEGYKQARKTWADTRELGPLKNPHHAEQYQKLVSAIDRLTAKWTQARRQFNSLRELDNALVEQLDAAGDKP